MSTDLDVPAPQGDYVPAVCHDGVIYTAGMTPRRAGALVWTGIVGDSLTAEEAHSAAGLAMLNALTAARSAMPGPGALRCLRLTVFIACTPEFTALSAVADGASAVLAAELGVAALPARSAIGVCALPSGAPIEVELTAAVL